MTSVLVDTGFLVSLFRPADRLRAQARACLQMNRHPLITVTSVIVETCFFLDAAGKGRLLEWVERGALDVADVPVSAYRKIDFADAALVWLAEQSGCRAILTVDLRDFGVYRLKGGKRFELVKWIA